MRISEVNTTVDKPCCTEHISAVGFKHTVADVLLNNNTSNVGKTFTIKHDDFLSAIKDIVSGKPLFPTPERAKLEKVESIDNTGVTLERIHKPTPISNQLKNLIKTL